MASRREKIKQFQYGRIFVRDRVKVLSRLSQNVNDFKMNGIFARDRSDYEYKIVLSTSDEIYGPLRTEVARFVGVATSAMNGSVLSDGFSNIDS